MPSGKKYFTGMNKSIADFGFPCAISLHGRNLEIDASTSLDGALDELAAASA
jgi:hypothetical protein